jgi:hypothetical protein
MLSLEKSNNNAKSTQDSVDASHGVLGILA